MENFKINYDENNDDLFLYLENTKSKGAIELGNFVFDFDEKENIVGIQIFEASKVLSKLFSQFIEMTKIKDIKADIINFRNMNAMKLKITTDSDIAEGVVVIPRIKFQSPALNY